LDTYFAERHPVAEEVLSLTRAQSELLSIEPGPLAVRRLLTELVAFEDVAGFLAEKVTSIGIRYDFGKGHPLLGRRMRDLPVGTGRLYDHLRDGRGVLLDQTGMLSIAGRADRITHLVDRDAKVAAPGILLRPDGHIAWLGAAQGDLDRQLAAWFGHAPHSGE
jgi:hypothetical protein